MRKLLVLCLVLGGCGNTLTWEPNQAADSYRIYRSTDPLRCVSTDPLDTVIGETTRTKYRDWWYTDFACYEISVVWQGLESAHSPRATK